MKVSPRTEVLFVIWAGVTAYMAFVTTDPMWMTTRMIVISSSFLFVAIVSVLLDNVP